MKYKPAFNRDWLFYYRNRRKFTFSGTEKPVIVKYNDYENIDYLSWCKVAFVIHDKSGVTAKEAFKAFDSTGKAIPCRQPNLLSVIHQCKKAINFAIKQWADGFLDMCEHRDTYLSEFINPPPWVKVSLNNQIDKKIYG